jgi:signal transduction histidine kinase
MNTTNATVWVLLIEDNPGDALLIREMLRDARDAVFVLETCATLADGVSALLKRRYDVVLLDINLPDSSGTQTVQRLLHHHPENAVVVMTGFDDQESAVEALKAGAQDYLVKGETNSNLLVRSIRYAIERHRIDLAEAELAALKERQRLARELHDSVSQTLFTANVMAESALLQWDHNLTKARSLVEEVQQLTSSATAEMRILLLELRPVSLTQIHFQQLVEQLIHSQRAKHRVQATFDCDTLPSLSPDVQIALYRIIQEALNNMIKHSRATSCVVEIRCDDFTIDVIVRDNGRGFDVATASPTSFGLSIMHERAESIGAQLDIQSIPGKGTQVRVIWHPQEEGE